MDRALLASGTPWEEEVGYSRAICVGNRIEISGTTAVENGQVQFPGDPYAQTRFILEKMGQVLAHFGSGYEQVIRTRLYVTDIRHWEAIGRAHGAFFREIKPATSMVQVAGLIDPDMLVEVEMSAVRE